MQNLRISFLLILLSAAFSQIVFGQGNTTYSFKDFPVDIDYPEGWRWEQSSRKSWVLSDQTTEFNVILFRANRRFNADSLRYFALDLYEDPSIQNLQVSEIKSGTIGKVEADKVILSFSAGGKQYLSTIYLAKIHLNHMYNRVLFYYEIGESNAPAYTPIQDFLISSLRYRDINYMRFDLEGVVFEHPNHWATRRIQDDTTFTYFSDGRANFSIFRTSLIDSTSASALIDLRREQLKRSSVEFPELKTKTLKEKTSIGTWHALELRYQASEYGVLFREIQRTYYGVIRKKGGGFELWKVHFVIPEGNEDFYTPVEQKVIQSLSLPGELLP